jgi:hypothetical protein
MSSPIHSRTEIAMIVLVISLTLLVAGALNTAAQRRLSTHPGVETWR